MNEQIGGSGLPCGSVGAEENPMGSFSIWHWMLVLAVFLLLFGGRGKISELMGDFAQGIKSFKKGMQDEDTAKADPKPLDHQPTEAGAAELKRRAETSSTS
jgi:sec-independent protein translocase protein TatA